LSSSHLRFTSSSQCSHEENFAWLNAADDGQTAVKIANPKTLEFQVVRTSLLPGLLKTIRENRSHALPLRIFEASDVVFKDTKRERQARNVRHAAAVWCNKTAGFEIVHGLLDRAMGMLEVPHIPGGAGASSTWGYYIKEREGALSSLPLYSCFFQIRIRNIIADPTFFPGRAATIYYRARPAQGSESTSSQKSNPTTRTGTGTGTAFGADAKRESGDGKDVEIGRLGILHPSVLEKFEIGYPCSALEFSLEPFKAKVPALWTNDDI